MSSLISKIQYYIMDHIPKSLVLEYVNEVYYDDLHEFEADHEDYSSDLD